MVPLSVKGTLKGFAPHWHSYITDSLMLVPVSQTCHRLREVTVDNPLLWRHGYAKGRSSTFPVLLSRSGGVHLTLILSYDNTMDPEFRRVAFPRSQELHLVQLSAEQLQQLHTEFNSPWPFMEHLSISQRQQMGRPISLLESLPLHPDNMPKLRYLQLQSVSQFPPSGFPTLTHLFLSNIMIRENFHPHLLNFLSSCPKLINLTLSGLNSDIPQPLTSPPSILPSLQRATLMGLNKSARDYYLPLLAAHDRTDFALQVLWPGMAVRNFSLDELIPKRNRKQGTTLLAIAIHYDPVMHPTPRIPQASIPSVTAVSSSMATRVAGGSTTFSELHRMLSSTDALVDVRELWLVNVNQESIVFRGLFTTTSAVFPVLNRATLVVDHTSLPNYTPSLCMLHKQEMSALGHVKTVRVIHGYSKFSSAGEPLDWTNTGRRVAEIPHSLDLSWMITQLQSGDYHLPDTLVLQATEHFYMDQDQLDALRRLVAEVRVERITALPGLPLPGFCVELAAGVEVSTTSMW